MHPQTKKKSVKGLVRSLEAAQPSGYKKNNIDYESFVTLANINKGEKVIEVGVGYGMTIPFILKRTQNAVFGDFSERYVNVVNDKYPVSAICLDGRNLPFEDNVFDVYISNFTFHNLPSKSDKVKFISEASRVVKPGGKCLFGMIPSIYFWVLRPENYINSSPRKKIFNYIERNDSTYFQTYSFNRIINLFEYCGIKTLECSFTKTFNDKFNSDSSREIFRTLKRNIFPDIFNSRYFDALGSVEG